jgi:acetyl-CoA carboxylase biotin carboxylase subunit
MGRVIRRVLVANRGEIAVRVIRACREAGLETIAVYSDVDRHARHVRLADRSVRLGPAAARESYLSIGAVIDAARATEADAVHPGYGFLSENAEFAEACGEARLAFVGPTPDAMRHMGTKIEARRRMAAAGVPVVPGETPADQRPAGVQAAAEALGFPLVLKASAGGGGKGMRIVRHPRDLDEAIGQARREAEHAFGDGTLYVERLLDHPRHVEVQVLADEQGAVVHLFERDCSVQRRHQKIIEETPSPALSPALREDMGRAAVAAARAVGYVNAGTVEFLVDDREGRRAFYFLEMNTRLQVEHPITEAVVGVDLVRAQLAIASGAPLPWPQEALRQRGHAVECRVYAEDPAQGFLPQAGPLLRYREPAGPGVRVDSGVEEGDEVTVHYDPLLAKLVTWGESREQAVERAVAALREYIVLGIPTNLAFLGTVLEHPAFRSAQVDVGFVERELGTHVPPASETLRALAAAAAVLVGRSGGSSAPHGPGPEAARGIDPWTTLRAWTN